MPTAKTKTTEKPKKEKPLKLDLPKTLAATADKLYTTRQARLALQKDVDALKKTESALEEVLINKLPKDDATGVTGSVARATIEVSPVPIITDETALLAFVKKTGQNDLLQKPKLAVTAVRERWDAKKAIPGVGVFNVVKVHLNKR